MTEVAGQDRSALKWLKADLNDLIQQATQALGEFVENNYEGSQIKDCAEHIHKIQGTLKMVQLHGAHMLAEEMEEVVSMLVQEKPGAGKDGSEALMVSLVQLPQYLDRLEKGAPDLPFAILSILNDLRASRDANLLSESALFAPHLNQMLVDKAGDGQPNPALQDVAKKMRGHFHRGLLGWYKQIEPEKSLKLIRQVFGQMYKSSGMGCSKRIWEAAQALIVGVEKEVIEPSISVKLLIGHIDREIKYIIDKGELATECGFALSLLKNILFYIANADSDDKLILHLQNKYQLKQAIDAIGGEGSGVVDADLLAAVRDAIQEDLTHIKDTIDLYIRGDRSDLASLGGLQEVFGKVADTFGMLGQGELQKRIRKQADDLQQKVGAGQAPSDDDMMALAGDLLFVESSLATLSQLKSSADLEQTEAGLPQGELRAHIEVALKEAAIEMAHIKEALMTYLESPDSSTSIENTPEQFTRVAGAFQMITEPKAAEIVSSTKTYVQDELLQGQVPSSDDLDLLAEVVTSIEYYMEALLENAAEREGILDFAHESLNSLLKIESQPEAEPVTETEFATTIERAEAETHVESEAEVQAEEAGDETAEIEIEAVELTEQQVEQTATEESLEAISEPLSMDLELVEEEQSEEAQPVAEPEDEISHEIAGIYESVLTEEQLSEGLPLDTESVSLAAYEEEKPEESEPAAETEAEELVLQLPDDETELSLEAVEEGSDSPVEESKEAEELQLEDISTAEEQAETAGISDEVDSEILEVFIEEAEEVLETLNEQYPAWKQDHDNADALAIVRRSFHTLKGSGRMVGANVFGEFAWSVENMLNRLIENRIQVSPAMLHLLDEVMDSLPGMIEAQKTSSDFTVDVDGIQARAFDLAEGKMPSEEVSEETPVQETETLELLEEAPVDTSVSIDESLEADVERLSLEEVEDFGFELPEDLVEESEVESILSELDAADEAASEQVQEEIEAIQMPADEEIADEWQLESITQETTEAVSEEEQQPEAIPEAEDTTEPEADIEVEGMTEFELSEAETEENAEPEEKAEAEVQEQQADLMLDSTLSDIFISESKDHLQVIESYLENCREGRDCGVNEPLTRAVHTLRGSAFMAEVEPVANVASSLEKLLNGLAAYEVEVEEPDLQLLQTALATIKSVNRCINVAGCTLPDWQQVIDQIEQRIKQVQNRLGDNEPESESGFSVSVETPEFSEADATIISEMTGEDMVISEPQPESEAEITAEEAAAEEPDEELVEIFLEEAHELQENMDSALKAWSSQPDDASQIMDLQRTLHTLKGGARLAGISALGDLSHAMESFLISVDQGKVEVSEVAVNLAQQGADRIASQIDQLADRQDVTPDQGLIDELEAAQAGEIPTEIPAVELEEEPGPPVETVEAVTEVGTDELESEESISDTIELEGEPAEEVAETETESKPEFSFEETSEETLSEEIEEEEPDEELVEIFLEEARELQENMDRPLQAWSMQPDDSMPIMDLQRTLHTLKGGARLAGVSALGDLSHAMESFLISIDQGKVEASEAAVNLAQRGADRIASQIDQLADRQPVTVDKELLQALEAAQSGRFPGGQTSESGEVAQPESVETIPQPVPSTQEPVQEQAPEQVAEDESLSISQMLEAEASGDLTDSVLMPESLMGDEDIIETAAGIEAITEELSGLVDEMQQPEQSAEKSPEEMPEQAAASEFVETAEPQPEIAEESDSSLLTDSRLLIDSQLKTDAELLRESEMASSDFSSESLDAYSESHTTELIHFPMPGEEEKTETKKKTEPQTREQVRVNAELLDKLVNNAGEVSIYRSRLEQQNNTQEFNLTELEQTVERLNNQLRQLEIETEAQILFRYEKENEEFEEYDKEFDPLELDRFSTIQQLSRALSETVNDLVSIKDSMGDLSRDTETLLMQQSRLATDLQDGLLRTRMIPIMQQVNRLQRVVRQTAQSLGKKARLESSGTVDEMDRRILDRIVGPLEHLMRNAVGHGIENPQDREADGKPAEGKITLNLEREGTEILLSVSDDGQGLNLESIRRRAVEIGLMDANAELDDNAVMQFILEPGFSTADEVTQIAGRGVGMDVVTSEVKQLGGALEIESEPGRGTSFNIRLPYTLAISDALLVRVGEESYAIPHTSIEGVIRVSQEQIGSGSDEKPAEVEYAGHHYQIRYMGNLLGVPSTVLTEQKRWAPVLLVRAGEMRLALQVDQLLGNRQVVVKSVGSQLANVRWISGGTILGDGQVALIIDVNALIRSDVAHRAVHEEAAEEASSGVVVMVVDDSITVRKVTSRLLGRHNMHVITAKDGVDALAQLQDHMPDVMLLDIEMPRMDGFELARQMQHTAELQNIPIIMITSRTGEKHRDRAFSLGVKQYLGKPYQEEELLENIYTALAEKE